MKRIILLFFNFQLLTFNLFGQSGWFNLNSPTTSNLNSSFFIDEYTGYIAGDNGTIIKTTDGGGNWLILPVGTNERLGSCFFLNASTGFVGGSYGTIFKTTNGGANFQTISVDSQYYSIYSIFFNNANTGFLADYRHIFRTSNGGMNWNPVITYVNWNFSSLKFFNLSTGIAMQSYLYVPPGTTYLIKTTDGGNNWNSVYNFGNYSVGIFFLDSLTGYASQVPYFTGTNNILKTSNFGINWSIIYSNGNDFLGRLLFLDTVRGYALGNYGRIYHTSDGGHSWFDQSLGQGGLRYYDISFPTVWTGYVVGPNGYIRKTTNGGEPIGIEPNSNQVPEKFELYQNYPNPFNPETKIKFDISSPAPPSKGEVVSLKIFDVLGREVVSLVNEALKPGTYEVEWDGTNFPSGVYYYKLTAGDFTQAKKMVLIK